MYKRQDEDKSEDEILAKNVPGIDLIISGHTHTQLDEPIRHGDTYIVSCGEYGRNLGTISMTQKDDGRWDVDTYELIPVTDEIKADAATQERIDKLMETVDTNYLSHFGYTKDQILAENDIEFSFEDFTDKMAFELQVLCNGLIRDDLEVSIQYPTRVEASKMAKGKNLDRDDLRVVRIGALDYNMCGCMHVPSLRYLQMLYISGYEKTAKGYKIKYLVGDQLLDCVSRRYKVLDEASRSLAVSHLYVNTGVNRLINETRQLNRDIVVWKQKYYEMFGKELGQSEEDIIIHFFDDIDVKSEADVAKYVTENYKKAVIFVAKTYDNVHVVVASHKDMDFDSAKVFKEIADAYHLKGGGSARLSQGGGMYSEEIIKFVKTHRFS